MKKEVFEKDKHYKFYFDKMELTERLGKEDYTPSLMNVG